MRQAFLVFTCLLTTGCLSLFGQAATVVGTGYSTPAAIRVAPGQVATFFVTGLKTVLASGVVTATVVPLPTSLAGISVTLNQSGAQPYAAPLFAVRQISGCDSSGGSSSGSVPPQCLTTAITVQIPFDLPYAYGPIDTQVVISENGTASQGFKVVPVTDNVHILTTCDSFPPVTQTGTSCLPVVTHGDGTIITPDSPAAAGEEIVIYAFGLGPNPGIPVQTGVPSPSHVPISFIETVGLLFDTSTNAPPKNPLHPYYIGQQIPSIGFAGLVPGYVGLYQINLQIPQDVATSSACGGGYSSNLTIDIGFLMSSDGAPICIVAQGSAAQARPGKPGGRK